ncbi:response regulator [Mariprofundus ferrooxydans]|nr:response regulator [Mariprofundus ferrooxydans]
MKLLPKRIPLRIAWYGLILLASLIPAIILAPWLAGKAHGLLLDRAILSEKMFHRELETRIDLETERLISVLENKSDPISYFISHGDDANIIRHLIEKIDVREAILNSISIYNIHAKLVFSTHKKNHMLPAITVASAGFVVPMHQRVFIGSPKRLSDNHFEFVISVPLIYQGENIGVMVSSININEFWNSIRKKLPKHNSQVYLVDGRGTLLTHPPHSRYKQGELLSKHAIIRSLLAHKDWHKVEVYKGFENSNVFGIGTDIPGLGWGIISEIPEGKIDLPIKSSLIMLVVIVLFLHLIFSILGLLFTRRLLDPILDLAEVMKKATTGDYKHTFIKPSLYQEIDDLGSSFNTMLYEIDVRESSLRKQNYVMEQLGESLIITNQHGVIEYVNPSFIQTTGYSFDEAIGSSPSLISSGTQSKSFYANMWRTILAGNAWEGRLINCKKDGTLYPTMMSVVPVYYEGELTNFIAIQQDMSEQVKLEDQLRQSQKMEAIGTLVGGIAHDFNNMLAGITGNLYLAKKMVKSEPKVVKKLENIESLSFRAADMIKQLLTFSRQDAVRMQTMDITSRAYEVLNFLRPTIPENILIHEDICADKLLINGDETQLHQVLMNLINNARDALENSDNPSITVQLSRFIPDGAFIQKYGCSQIERYAHISIADNGMGISNEHLEHLFEPFFTTKEEGKGTGLGLSMVFGAIETHKGFIEVESREGEGTTFHIYIPLLGSNEIEIIQVEAETTPVKELGGELILLVDDELQVRETTAEVLESMGYKVLQAEDGIAAEDVFKQHQYACCLVILDIVMPHCGGVEAAANIRKINPNVPVIFMSGYDREKVLKSNQLANSQVLSKPIALDKLKSIIRHMLH